MSVDLTTFNTIETIIDESMKIRRNYDKNVTDLIASYCTDFFLVEFNARYLVCDKLYSCSLSKCKTSDNGRLMDCEDDSIFEMSCKYKKIFELASNAIKYDKNGDIDLESIRYLESRICLCCKCEWKNYRTVCSIKKASLSDLKKYKILYLSKNITFKTSDYERSKIIRHSDSLEKDMDIDFEEDAQILTRFSSEKFSLYDICDYDETYGIYLNLKKSV